MEITKKRILLVDDNEAIHEDLKKILLGINRGAKSEERVQLEKDLFETEINDKKSRIFPFEYEINDAYQGLEAIKMVDIAAQEEYPYSLIFMDIRMPPGIDGIETIRRIWQNHPFIEVVICTAFSDYSWDQILDFFPSTDQLLFIRKPFDNVAIRQTTFSLLRKWDLNKKNREYVDNLEHEVERRTEDLKKINEKLLTEITERRRAEEEGMTLQIQLQHSQKMEAIGQLAGGVAHDFNNMLGAISGYAELIKKNFTSNNPRLERYVTTIILAAQRSADLTSKLLAFARKGKYEVVEIDFHEVINEALKILTHSIDKRIKINQRFDVEIPIVLGDLLQLQNMIVNLALNARDAMPHGGAIELCTEIIDITDDYLKSLGEHGDPGKYIRFTVTDTGIGMDEQTKARIFEPFFTTKMRGKGTGLGLSSVYGTVKSHNGFIETISHLGQGTTFNIYLKQVIGVNYTKSRENQSEESTVMDHQDTGTILIIDDERAFRNMCGDLLEDRGFHVASFNNPLKAIEYYKDNNRSISLVILDMIMPEMNGYTCYQHLKRIDKEIPVLVASGYSMDKEIQTMISEGVVGFIQKPFKAEKIINIIQDAIEEKKRKGERSKDLSPSGHHT